eukprot:TRINITY_DN73614_c0_g1_i1.p1 TRINITY_DN73614_c0_g1~~TRINITY_DN73614_c0_g1_i1.p1  ORF type:complete len:206 (-),score=31.27 TRINITY_DN73614_c0_g1_i1:87-704(-)
MGCSSSNGSAGSISLPPSFPDEMPREIHVFLHKREGMLWGARVADVRGQAVVSSIDANGLLQEWNRQNPQNQVRNSDIVFSVNNVTGNFWPMIFELQQAGTKHIIIRRDPQLPGEESDEEKGPVTLESEHVDSLEKVCVDYDEHCAICLENFVADEYVTRLPCKHVFHSDCAMRWLTGHSRCCPLCAHPANEELRSAVSPSKFSL